jgi:hypothetical protein
MIQRRQSEGYRSPHVHKRVEKRDVKEAKKEPTRVVASIRRQYGGKTRGITMRSRVYAGSQGNMQSCLWERLERETRGLFAAGGKLDVV